MINQGQNCPHQHNHTWKMDKDACILLLFDLSSSYNTAEQTPLPKKPTEGKSTKRRPSKSTSLVLKLTPPPSKSERLPWNFLNLTTHLTVWRTVFCTRPVRKKIVHTHDMFLCLQQKKKTFSFANLAEKSALVFSMSPPKLACFVLSCCEQFLLFYSRDYFYIILTWLFLAVYPRKLSHPFKNTTSNGNFAANSSLF